MKKLITLSILILLCKASFAQTWTQVSNNYPINGGGRDGASFSIGDTCYVIDGYSSQSWVFDTLTQIWTSITPYTGPNANGAFVGFSLNGMGYVGTGVGGGYTWENTMWQYNPTLNQWIELTSFPGEPRGYAVGFNIDGRLFLGCGIGNSTGSAPGLPLKDFYEYNPSTNTWDSIAHYPGLGNQEDVSFVIGDKAYVGCGATVNSSGNGVVVDSDFYEYDTTSKVWTRIADFPSYPRYGATGLGRCDKGYVGLGGNLSNTMFNDFWAYNPANNTWTQIANYGGNARYDASGFVIGKSLFVGVGVDQSGTTQTDLWEFIPTCTPAFSANTTVCQGGSITFTDTSNYSPTNWYWQFPSGTPDTSTSQNPTITYNTSGTYSVIFSAWNGCDSSTKTFTNYITVGSGGLLTVLPPSSQVCSGQNVTLSISGGGSNFTWSPVAGLSATSGSSVVATPTATTTYTVSGTSGGCTSTGMDTVNIVPAPALIIKPQDTTICNGSSVTLFAPSSGSGYIWSPTATLSSIAGDSAIASPTLQTTYTVTGVDSVGCAATGLDTVFVNKGFNKPIISDTNDLITSTATQGNQWYRDGIFISGANGESYIITDTGCYYDIATNIANGCSSISNTLCIEKLAGIKQLTINPNLLSIYPNPTDGEIFVNISSSVANVKDWNLQIIDVLGRTVYTKLSLNYSNDIDLSNLPGGVYFITVINTTGKAVVPIVKE